MGPIGPIVLTDSYSPVRTRTDLPGPPGPGRGARIRGPIQIVRPPGAKTISHGTTLGYNPVIVIFPAYQMANRSSPDKPRGARPRDVPPGRNSPPPGI